MSSNLMEKLAISKAIMDKHNNMGRGNAQPNITNVQNPQVEEFETPEIRYNIPQEFLSESKPIKINNEAPTTDRILNSKLPEEIKKLMMENPITPINPMSPSNSVLSDELVEKASRLMGTKNTQPPPQSQKQNVVESSDMRKMIKEVVREVLSENGLILESSSKTNETVVIKVGQHIFEGKISKVKKTK